MALPAVLIAIGAVMSAASQYSANSEQAKSELTNAEFYDQQAQFSRDAMSREAMLSRKKFSATIGEQKGAYAKSGVNLSKGSSVGVIANTFAAQMDELDAIIKKGELDYKLASGRAKQARDKAELFASPLYNFMSIGGSLLTSYGASAMAGSSSKSAGGTA